MRAIFHCGAYKTGSSTLQNHLYDHRQELLKEFGIFYPETGLRRHRHIGIRHSEFPFTYGTYEFDNLVQALISEVSVARKSGAHTLVLSSEVWSNPNMQKSLEVLSSRLANAGVSHFEAIIYFRNVYDYSVRHYREFTARHRNVLKYEEYVEKNINCFDFKKVVKGIDAIFSGSFRAFSYDDVGSTAAHFMKICGIPLEVKDGNIFNQGQTPIYCEMVRLANLRKIQYNPEIFDAQYLFSNFGISFSDSVMEPIDEITKFGHFQDDYIMKFVENSGISLQSSALLFKKPKVNPLLSVYDLDVILNPIMDRILGLETPTQ